MIFRTILLLLWTGTMVSASDWPQWMGPTRDGRWPEEGLLDTFPEDGAKVLWRAKIHGGYAGPSVSQSKVFVTDFSHQDGDDSPSPSVRNKLDGVERVLCLDAKTGKELWKHELSLQYNISYPAGPRATPTVDGDRVYTLGAEGDLLCLDVANGDIVWSKNLKKEYGAKTPQWGFCSHPLIEGDVLYCLVGGEGSIAVAFDKKTGKEIWRSLSAKEPGYSPPILAKFGDQTQLLVWHPESLNGLDPATGTPFWSVPLEPAYGMSIIPPTVSNNRIFVGAIVDQSMLVTVSGEQAKVTWRGKGNTSLGPVHSPPLVEGEYLYGVDHEGELRCVNLATGERIWETMKATTGGRRFNSATAFLVKEVPVDSKDAGASSRQREPKTSSDRYWIFNEQGDLILASLTPKGYEELTRAHILNPTTKSFDREVVWSHPAFANRCIFARNDEEIVCVSLSK